MARADLAASLPFAGEPGPGSGPASGFGARCLRALAEGSVLAAVLLAPLYFNPRSARVFEPDKLAWLLVLGLLAAACGLAWPLVAPLPDRGWWRAIFGRPLPLLTLFGLVASLAATALSVVPAISLWGSYRRGQGLLAAAGLWLLFGAALVCLRRRPARSRLWRFLLLPALPAAVYSLLQRFGIDSLGWSTYGASPAERAFAGLGNPIFLGAWLTLLAPLALALLLSAGPRRAAGEGRLALGAAGLLAALVGQASSASRGPLLAMAAGLGLALLLALGRRRSRLAAGLAATGAGVVSILVVFLLAVGPGDLALGRGRTVEQRLLIWQATADLMRASGPGRWLLGHGPESLPYVIGPHLPERLVQLTPTQFFDRAHSRLWDDLAAKGLLGLASGLAIPALALAIALNLLGWGTRRRLLAAGLGGAAAVAAASLLAGQAALSLALAPLGLLLGLLAAMGWTARAATGDRALPPQPAAAGAVAAMRTAGEDWLIMGLAGALAAHLLESAVGVPSVASDLVVFMVLALLAAIDASAAAEVDAGRAEPTLLAGRADAEVGAGGSSATDGLLEGLGLAAILVAPIFSPDPRRTLQQPILFLIPLAYVVALVLSTDRGRRPIAAAAGRRPRSVKALPAAAPWPLSPGSLARVAAWGLAPLIALGLDRLLGGRTGSEIAAWGAALLLALLLRAGLEAGGAGDRPRLGAAALPLAALAFLGGLGAWRLALAPLLADRHVRAGQEAAAAGDLPGAAERLAEAAAIWPEQPTVLDLQAGVAQLRMAEAGADEMARAARFDAARTALEAAMRLAPGDATGSHLGDLFRDRGDLAAPEGMATPWWTQARAAYQEALRRQPLSPPAWLGLAGAQERLGETASAGEAYDKAWRLNAGDAVAAAGSLRLALARGDWEGALERLEQALGPEGVDPVAYREAAQDRRGFPAPSAAFDQAAVLALAATGDRASAAARLAELKARLPADPLLGRLEAWLAGR